MTLVFSEPVTPAGTGIKVYAPSGRQVAAEVSARGAVLTAPLTASEGGTYVVLWQVYAADTHPSRGTFDFAVGRRSDNPYSGLLGLPQAGTATPLGLALQAIARWVHFAGFALTFGVVAYRLLVRRRVGFGRLVTAGVGLLILAEPLSFLGQLASLSFDGDTAIAVLGSGFGRILGLRLGAALLAGTLLATDRAGAVLAAGAAMAALDGASAHAFPQLPVAGQAVVAVHVSAMGLWAGGVAAFLRTPDARFARYAALTFGAALATGLVLALVHTSFGAGLFTSEYGAALFAKILVVAGAILAVVVRRRRLELALATAAIALASLLAALPPPL